MRKSIKCLNLLVSYELAHNPDLLNHTKVARNQKLRESASSIFKQNDDKLSTTSSVRPLSAAHWKTSYQADVQNNLSKSVVKSLRPEWSLHR